MPQQLSCRDMCKFVTRSDHQIRSRAGWIFARFQLQAHKLFAKWVGGTVTHAWLTTKVMYREAALVALEFMSMLSYAVMQDAYAWRQVCVMMSRTIGNSTVWSTACSVKQLGKPSTWRQAITLVVYGIGTVSAVYRCRLTRRGIPNIRCGLIGIGISIIRCPFTYRDFPLWHAVLPV